jgi:uncharacterized membrane protein
MVPSARHAARFRFDAVDLARGAAIAAMVIYHAAWDLSFLDFIDTNVVRDPGWRWFARGIAGTFLILVGIGLTLAHGEGVRRGAFLRRLVKIGAAALAITAATYAAFPQSYIFFGILHCIALGSVLALPFLRAPSLLVLATAALVAVAPRFLTDPALDNPVLGFLGLGSADPMTNDYVPIFPWFALILVGLLIGRGAKSNRATPAMVWRAKAPLARLLVAAGRFSLPIYLLHQLVLFGALGGARQILGPNPVAQCVRDCAAQGGADVRQCRAGCTCVVGTLQERGALKRILAGPPSAADQAILEEAARLCRRAAGQS